ncbi:mRNAse [uncultured phage cr106_1]|uniref:mRNAse n=1 Tax=uncultured phage cr106_1 TaxID=2772062 RepID=A0A7M1RV77_9CAUD|nr:mRNAse [uncultured phage cr106_1]QOR58335.1 mRNAse [uncultured phage cr106_1]
MRQFTHKEFVKIVIANGFCYDRHNGDHAIYLNNKGRHISIPDKLACVIAARLIKENNLETNIKKLKKEKRMSNLPAGAKYDSRAPFNEPLNVEYKRFVSASISYYDTVELPTGANEEQINEAFKEKVSNGQFPKEFDIDEVIILEE